MKKKSKLGEESKFRIFFALAIVLIILFITTNFSLGADRKTCPYEVEGNLDADLVIKYIDSPYCVYCWLEEPILNRLVETKGDSFRLERYDIRYCNEIVEKYRFSGTPSFVFSMEDGTKEFLHYGFIGEKDLSNVICEITGDC
jgi:thiol-disulfide isomerase/thioredoxin